ncbi:MAG: GNAT family N-acetyltransferase [Oscillospiraceae bacterium]|nr:GNAT family N-acetyltransferase [Oscillospiraceae bacterium]
MSSPIIRKALAEDAYEYAALHIACWKAAYKGIISDEYLQNMSVDEMGERTQQYLQNPGDFLYYCLEFDGSMIGRLVLNKSRDDDKPDAAEIGAMYLLDAYWDKGLGRKMMEFSLEEFQRMGYSEMILWVLEANNRARQFYEKFGFAFDGTMKEMYIDKPHTVLRYTKRIM